MDDLPCTAVIYRTITRASDFQDGQPLSGAFIRRVTDKDGLSVDYGVAVPEECSPDLSGKKAIVSLLVGKIRDLAIANLDVVPDSETHAAITNVPFPSEDPLLAEQCAAALVEISRVQWTK